MAGFQVPWGTDLNSPIAPQVPMSSASVTARGPDISRKIVGAEEAGGVDRINETAAAIDAAKRAEADAIKAQNDLESKRRKREAAVLRSQQEDMRKAEADRAANREKKQLAFDAEEKAYTEKHGGSQDFWDNHPVGDKILSGIAIALGGLGMAMAGRPGENPGLEAVNRTIGQWHSDRQKQLEIDRDKLTRSKARIEDVDAWYEKEKLRNEARYKAELAAIAKEFDSQAATLKSPEARAKAEQEAAKFRMEAEKNKQFYLEGQRQTENQSGVTMSATNTAPTSEGVVRPGVPRIPGVAPAAGKPAASTVQAGAPPVVGQAQAATTVAPTQAAATSLPATMAQPSVQKPKVAKPVVEKPKASLDAEKPASLTGPRFDPDGGITLPNGQKIDKRRVASSGILYGHNGAPIGLYRNPATAEEANKIAHKLKDYRNETLSLKAAAQAVADAGTDLAKKNQALRRFQATQSMVVNKGKPMVGDALSESEKKNVLALTWEDLVRGTGDAAIEVFIRAIDGRVSSEYQALGIDPREAMPVLYGSKPKAAAGPAGRKVVRTGKNKAGKRVVQYDDGAIEVAE